MFQWKRFMVIPSIKGDHHFSPSLSNFTILDHVWLILINQGLYYELGTAVLSKGIRLK